MPEGLVVVKWDGETGAEIIAEYPKEINVTDKIIMQVISSHEYIGEAGILSLMVDTSNIVSYYTGPENNYYLLLFLGLEDNPDAYKGCIADASRLILQNLEDEAYLRFVPSLFQRISAYPSYNEEQLLAMTYHDDIKRMVINRLRNEGVISKSELRIWIKDIYKYGFADIDGVLVDLSNRDLIKQASVKGMSSKFIFLINDLLIARVPPKKLLKKTSKKGLPANLVEIYRNQCKAYFQNYRFSEESALEIVKIVVNPNNYEILRVLRSMIATRQELDKLKKKGIDNIDEVLKCLEENQMIHIFQDHQGKKYFALLSDFYISLFFPNYLLDIVKHEYDEKAKSNQVLIEYLKILESEYLESQTKAKGKYKKKLV